jgi:hypothetical protein
MVLKAFLILVAGTAFACAPAVQMAVTPRRCPAGGLPDEAVPAELTAPAVRGLPILPVPVPASERGRRVTIRLVIDTAGRPLRDSVTVCGVHDPRYEELVAEKMATLTFSPARRDGSPVVWPTRLVVQLASDDRRR